MPKGLGPGIENRTVRLFQFATMSLEWQIHQDNDPEAPPPFRGP